MVLERNNMPDSYEAHFPQVSLSVAGRSEVESRAVIVVTDRTSFTSPMPEHRGRHPPPPPAPNNNNRTTGTERTDDNNRTIGNERATDTERLLHGDSAGVHDRLLHRGRRDGDARPGNATANRIGNSCAKGSGHRAAEDYLEQQEGEGFRGASSTSSTEDAAIGKANCSIGRHRPALRSPSLWQKRHRPRQALAYHRVSAGTTSR